MPFTDDQYFYSAEEIEVLLLAGPTHYIDHLDRVSDVERAFRWLTLEYPTGARLIRAVLAGWTLPELATKLEVTPERVDAELVKSYERMATWLNQERKHLT